jgi:hypothetical protein
MVIRQRRIQISHATTIQSSTGSTYDDATNMQNRQSNVTYGDTSTDAVDPSNGKTQLTSQRQMNVLQTMILITASFIILWMPTAVTMLLIFFEVSLFSFQLVKVNALNAATLVCLYMRDMTWQ